MKNISFSAADITDHQVLSEIAYSAKSHWGYPDSWLQLWKDDLTITKSCIIQNHVFKITNKDSIIGFAVISDDPENHCLEVEHMWVLPEHMGNGYGARLLNYALDHTTKNEYDKVRVVSDPNAVGFYNKQGFITIGQVPSTPEGRSLPLMEKDKKKAVQ